MVKLLVKKTKFDLVIQFLNQNIFYFEINLTRLRI